MSTDPHAPVPRPTELAHRLVEEALAEGALAIDATAGNGHDTLFLAQRVGENGCVLAFDIQAAAIESTRVRVTDAGLGRRVRFFRESHANLASHAEAGSVSAILFNLGYLPGGDHGVITEGGETLKALKAALPLLRPGGVLTVVCYPGHEGGAEESEAVLAWSRSLEGFETGLSRRTDTLRPAPFLVWVARRAEA